MREFLPAGFGEGYGHIAPCYVGSLTIVEPDAPYIVRRETQKTKCVWSPFEGFTLPGRTRYTVLRGIVHEAHV